LQLLQRLRFVTGRLNEIVIVLEPLHIIHRAGINLAGKTRMPRQPTSGRTEECRSLRTRPGSFRRNLRRFIAWIAQIGVRWRISRKLNAAGRVVPWRNLKQTRLPTSSAIDASLPRRPLLIPPVAAPSVHWPPSGLPDGTRGWSGLYLRASTGKALATSAPGGRNRAASGRIQRSPSGRSHRDC
jgi:hypothetical protein